MIPRTKCVATRRYRGAPCDPELELGRWYDVVDDQVMTMADETPYIEVRLQSGKTIQRPRHMFGAILSTPIREDQMTRYTTIGPANGRDYRSQHDALVDFEANKDFVVHNLFDRYDGKHANKTLLRGAGYTHVYIRYNRMRRVFQVRIV